VPVIYQTMSEGSSADWMEASRMSVSFCRMLQATFDPLNNVYTAGNYGNMMYPSVALNILIPRKNYLAPLTLLFYLTSMGTTSCRLLYHIK
jgi:hypothetical protein